MKKSEDVSARKLCPDEMSINRYVLDLCPKEERRKIEDHLSICPFCRQEVMFIANSQEEIQDEKRWGVLPEVLYKKALDLLKTVKPGRNRLVICLKFISQRWEIIRHTGELIPQPLTVYRGKPSFEKVLLSTLVKKLNGYKVEADVRGNGDETIDLVVRVKSDEDGLPASQVRFTLIDMRSNRILEEFVRDGEKDFQNLTPGEYTIYMTQPGKTIGGISLDLRK